jgi:hypothetical protein
MPIFFEVDETEERRHDRFGVRRFERHAGVK